jgi:phage terminase large subunit GpA-like protein
MIHNRPLAYVGPRTLKAYHWKKQIGTADWVEENVYLNADASPIKGRMNLKYTPHLREMFDDIDKKHVWKGIGKFSTQTAKTTFILCRMAKKLDTKPGKAQFAIPNEDKVGEYLADKVMPFLNGVKTLKNKVEDYKQQEKARLKMSRVKLAGGDCVFTGASASSKRSKTVQEFYGDEVDLMDEGSLVEFEGRTKAFEKYGRKFLATSSQKHKNGEIGRAYDGCECKKEWHTPCPSCGHHWLAGSKDLKWPDREKGEGFYEYRNRALQNVWVECPDCGHKIRTENKDDGILTGKYFFHVVSGDPSIAASIGWAGNALAMFFTKFETIAGLLIDAYENGGYDTVSQIFLDYFDEIYEPETEVADKNDILLLGNGLPEKTVPKDTYKLYLTIDTQKDGFWFKVTAFEYGFRPNTVYHGFVETFDELELLMGYRFPKEGGGFHIVDKTLIDRMGIKERTAEVDAWIEHLIVREGLEGRVYPTIGVQNDSNGRLWFKTTLTKDVTTKERRKTPIEAIKLNNTLLKNELQNLIDRSVKRAKGEPGYEDASARMFLINQDIVLRAEERSGSVRTDYERQMTSEQYVFKIDTRTGKVATVQTWEKPTNNTDNHLWDCSVAAVAAALMDNVMLAQKPREDEFERAMAALPIR